MQESTNRTRIKLLLLSVLYSIHKISIMVNANIILFDPTYSMLSYTQMRALLWSHNKQVRDKYIAEDAAHFPRCKREWTSGIKVQHYQIEGLRMKHSTGVRRTNSLASYKGEECFVTEITFICLNDGLSVCTSSSIEGIKVLNMTIYKSLERKITRRDMICQH